MRSATAGRTSSAVLLAGKPSGPPRGAARSRAVVGRRRRLVHVVLAVVALVVARVGIAVTGVLLDVDAGEHDAGDVGAGLDHLTDPGERHVARGLLPTDDVDRLVDDAGERKA